MKTDLIKGRLGRLKQLGTLLIYLAMVLIFTLLKPNYLTLTNFRSILIQAAMLGIISSGMTLVMMTGGRLYLYMQDPAWFRPIYWISGLWQELGWSAIIYFAALIVGFAASFVPDFSRGWRNAQNTLEMEIPQGGIRSYYVSAPVIRSAGEPIGIDNLPENITPTISRLDLKVTVDEAYTLGNAFKVMGNNSFCYLLMVITGLSYLTILVLIALIINSLRKSIRDEQPLRHSNILRTRAIGILILVGELSEAFMKYLNNNEAVRLLEGTSFEVVQTFPLSYWNVIVGILFLFMAEVLSLGTQLSEEQKLTI